LKWSVVLPIHNEEKTLPTTLPSIYNLQPNEVILILDRCTDHSERICRIIKDQHPDTDTRIIQVNGDHREWTMRGAYLRRLGYIKASHDAILNTAADIIHDLKIKQYMDLIGEYGLISFGFLDYPYNIQCWLRKAISTFTPFHGFAGLQALSRTAWQNTEDLKACAKLPRSEDTHLYMAINSRYKTKFINTGCIHLRPNETQRDHYLRGQTQWTLLHKSLWFAIMHSILMVRPASLVGYLHARKHGDINA